MNVALPFWSHMSVSLPTLPSSLSPSDKLLSVLPAAVLSHPFQSLPGSLGKSDLPWGRSHLEQVTAIYLLMCPLPD